MPAIIAHKRMDSESRALPAPFKNPALSSPRMKVGLLQWHESGRQERADKSLVLPYSRFARPIPDLIGQPIQPFMKPVWIMVEYGLIKVGASTIHGLCIAQRF